jgi:hypothetical protein
MIQNVQRRATKQLTGLKNLSYPERLRKLKLPTLTLRRICGDMKELYKILSHTCEPSGGHSPLPFISLGIFRQRWSSKWGISRNIDRKM